MEDVRGLRQMLLIYTDKKMLDSHSKRSSLIPHVDSGAMRTLPERQKPEAYDTEVRKTPIRSHPRDPPQLRTFSNISIGFG